MTMPLLLASQSRMRSYLLEQACIPFTIIKQNADECSISWDQPIDRLVGTLASLKMAHVIMPQEISENTIAFVLTADTLTQDLQGNIYGKPANYNQAIEYIKALRAGSIIATGFCIEKKEYKNNQWITQERNSTVVVSSCVFDVPDHLIDYYICNSPALEVAGAMSIEKFGMHFLKSVIGSYSGILGLPIYEVRQTLEQLGFFST